LTSGALRVGALAAGTGTSSPGSSAKMAGLTGSGSASALEVFLKADS
jgi:hypothetical protein